MLGAILGDIAGSTYEFCPTNDYNFNMFANGSSFTDDTVCTVAIADAILRGKDYGETLHDWCRRYPNPKGGYGGSFRRWVESNSPQPYGSFGNGSAMRVSPVAWAFSDVEQAIAEAEKTAACTHSHREGIKGAQAVVTAINYCDRLRRSGEKINRESIARTLKPVAERFGYNINIRKEDVQNRFDETCQGTVPVALWIITESTDFEDAIRRAVSLGADADTLGAIVGSIAEALWTVPTDLALRAMDLLPTEMKRIVLRLYTRTTPEARAVFPLAGDGDEGAAQDLLLDDAPAR